MAEIRQNLPEIPGKTSFEMSGKVWFKQTPQGVELFAQFFTEEEDAVFEVLVQPKSGSVLLMQNEKPIVDRHFFERTQ